MKCLSTPHKPAAYQSPKKKVSSRKKKRNPDQWKRNIRKNQRSLGKQYTSATGKCVLEKHLKPHNRTKCRFKCNQKFSEEHRQHIFYFYYGLGNYERQRHFICDMVHTETPIRKGKQKRSVTQKFHLVAGERKERVCRDFFMRTLDIGRKTIDYTTSKRRHGAYEGTDMRGKTASVNKLSNEASDFVHKHIQSFPKMESHYSRKKDKERIFSP